MTIAPVLTIAGSDSSGGAGVQADLKTMTMLGCFGMSAITALTAQNTLGVQGICPVPAEFLKQQIAAVCEDIPPAAVKVGMVYDTPQILAIAEAVAQYQLPHVVVDPVMVATSFAPDEIPSTKGPAMGFAKNVWSRKPDTDSAPPSITAERIRGRRMSHTMRYEAASPVLLNRISPISSTDRCTLPELMFQINKKHIMTARRANEILFFI